MSGSGSDKQSHPGEEARVPPWNPRPRFVSKFFWRGTLRSSCPTPSAFDRRVRCSVAQDRAPGAFRASPTASSGEQRGIRPLLDPPPMTQLAEPGSTRCWDDDGRMEVPREWMRRAIDEDAPASQRRREGSTRCWDDGADGAAARSDAASERMGMRRFRCRRWMRRSRARRGGGAPGEAERASGVDLWRPQGYFPRLGLFRASRKRVMPAQDTLSP
jgi:hypothetical protein